jgi:VWFA-related protein
MPKQSGQSVRTEALHSCKSCGRSRFAPSVPLRLPLAALAAGLVFLSAASAQQITPPPTDPADTPSQPVLTLHSDTRRVVVDIVVTDPKGNPVTTLTRKDFSVFENNTPQTIHDFELHTITSQPDYVPPKLPKLPANTFANLAAAPATGNPTVLLYDVLNTPIQDQQYAHQEMVHFLRHRRPGVQVAIFVLGSKLQMLQGFTDDETQLEAALVRKKGGPSSSLLIGGNPGATNAAGILSDTDPAASATTGISTAPSSQPLTETEISAGLTHMESLDESALLDQRVEITLDALTQIGRFLSGLPGRKNLVWLSASFPANILPDATLSATAGDHDQSIRNYSDAMKAATDLLNLSHVAVYPVDVRGVQTNPGYNAGTNQTFNPGATSFASDNLKFTQSQAAEHGTMDSIADSTGGHAFYGTNDLQEAVGDAMANGSTYYSLTYSPTNSNFDGDLRHIKVKLQEAGYTLAYRKTYFADDLHKAAEDAEDAPVTPLGPSLEHGTPLAHQLFIEAHLETYGAPTAATPQQMLVLSKFAALQTLDKKKSRGPLKPLPPVMMQRYIIEYGLVPRQLELPVEPGGQHRSSLEFGIISYDADGNKLNGLDSKIDDTIPAVRYAHIEDIGYHIVQTVAVPVDTTSLRLAVRDVLANRVGSIEVNLPLASAPIALHSLDSGSPPTSHPSSK